jgi:hypothetical protein
LLTSLIQNIASFHELSQFEEDNKLVNIENLIKFNAIQLKERDYYEISYNNEKTHSAYMLFYERIPTTKKPTEEEKLLKKKKRFQKNLKMTTG